MRRTTTALAVAAALVGVPVAHAGSIDFAPAPFPQTDARKRAVLASPGVTIDGQTFAIGYNVIMRSGARPGRGKGANDGVFGQLVDSEGERLCTSEMTPRVANDNDFSSLVRGENAQLYMVSHFESRPAAMYLTELDQDRKSGALTARRTRVLDFSHVEGGWVHCAGSVTPWGNHLGSEEYEPDARQWVEGAVDNYNAAMAAYFPASAGYPDLNTAALDVMNPYAYGYGVEVKVESFDHATVEKRYAMGRVAQELTYVMPDEKTAYLSDDGSFTALLRFVADNKGDLGSGELFAAKWIQTGARNGGSADLEWISLGHATDAQIKGYVDDGIGFDDILDYADPDIDGDCPTGLTRVVAGHGGRKVECLAVRNGMDRAASRLETRRYAALQGATTEWEKMEGITHDPGTNTMYLAMSRVRSGMTDGEGDIDVEYNYCGTVYALVLGADYVATAMHGEVSGIPRVVENGAAVDDLDAIHTKEVIDGRTVITNGCDVNGISEPDNITFLPGYGTLIIGEDTGNNGHQNDVIWAYDLASGELTRIQTTPYGSETTSAYFYPNINGFGYLMSVIQHPYGESDSDKLIEPKDALGYTGYIGPFPAMD